jgi:hypothetical protein
MAENTLRALTSDLAYLQAWSLAATGASLPWPAPEALALKFVVHHLWQPEQRDIDPHPACQPLSTKSFGNRDISNPSVRTRRRRCADGSRTGRR